MSTAYTSTSSMFAFSKIEVANVAKKRADSLCDYFACLAPASQHDNASNIQWRPNNIHRKNEDMRRNDFERNKEALDKMERRLEQLEANQGVMKLLSMTSIVCIGFSMLMVLICLMFK
ncbi:hypothetical protein CsSME_00023327 [Camellia sinensis var. sinensis]